MSTGADPDRRSPTGGASDLRQRFRTALIVGPPVLFALYLGTWPFAVVMICCGILILREWDRMTRMGDEDKALLTGYAAIFGAGVATAASQIELGFAAIAVGTIAMSVTRRETTRRLWMASGVAYAGLPTIGLIMMRAMPEAGFLAVGWTLTTVWATDIGAYAAGRAFGGPKLMPSVSPKKTWSGFVGGLVGAVLWSLGFQFFLSFVWIAGAVLSAIVVSLLGQSGDLFESWMKRRFGVKDSGTLFPGHGGIMDRADSVVAATAVIAIMSVVGAFFVPMPRIDTP